MAQLSDTSGLPITVPPSNDTANWDDPSEEEVLVTSGAFAAALGGPAELTALQVVSIAAITHAMTGYGFDLDTLPATGPAASSAAPATRETELRDLEGRC